MQGDIMLPPETKVEYNNSPRQLDVLIQEAFNETPWRVTVDESREGLVLAGKCTRCMDGRPGNLVGSEMGRGVAFPGGAYIVMVDRAFKQGKKVDEAIVTEALDAIEAAGLTPYIHDDRHGLLGCGYFRLMQENFAITAERIKEMLLARNGTFETLEGDHTENKLVINLVDGMTLEPDGSAFVVDLAVLEKLDVKPELVLGQLKAAVPILSHGKVIDVVIKK